MRKSRLKVPTEAVQVRPGRVAVLLTAVLLCCCAPTPPTPPTPPTAKSRTVLALPDTVSEIAYSSGSDKLYVAKLFGSGIFVVSLSAPSVPATALADAIVADAQHIVVNNRLKLAYVLTTGGTVRVFNTDTDTLVATSPPPA